MFHSVNTESFIRTFGDALTPENIQTIDINEYVCIMQTIIEDDLPVTILGERNRNFALAIEKPGVEIEQYPGKNIFVFYQY